jgi:Domain of unknown function (DUF397)
MNASDLADLEWRVSRTCESGACIKVARHGEAVLIGSTTGSDDSICEFTADEWREFLAGAKLGDFDNIP